MTPDAPRRFDPQAAGPPSPPEPPRPRGLSVTVGAFLVVLLLLSAALTGLDYLPGLLAGVPRGAVRVASVDDLGRALGFAFPLPTYYPDDLEWPPGRLLLFPGPSGSATVASRSTGAPALLIGVGAPGATVLPGKLLPPASVLQEGESTFGSERATVARVQDPDGRLWQQVSWSAHGRLIVVRYRGDLLRLTRMVDGMVR